MTEAPPGVAEVLERVARSRRYRDVDAALVRRLAAEELRHARSVDAAAKAVKRRLHEVVGAFRGVIPEARALEALRAAWAGDLHAPPFRDACRSILAGHASTRERLPVMEELYGRAWELTGGSPARLVDLACGLNPLALPWMGLPRDAHLTAVDADRRPLGLVGAFLELVGQPHRVEARDVVAEAPTAPADVALLLKLVPTLDRQDPSAAARLLAALPVRHAVVSFAVQSLGGHAKRMAAAQRERLDLLLAELGDRVVRSGDASVRGELVAVLELRDG